MKLFVKIISENEIHLAREDTQSGEEWYEIEREPDLRTEYLRYDSEKDIVVIEPRIKTADEIEVEQKTAEDAALMKADIIRQLQEKIAGLETRLANLEKVGS